MANSLKSLFPELSRVLGETPASLYAHQRTFVAAGLLDAAPGRGPGSGVAAGPKTLAQFLIATLTFASHAGNVQRAKAVAKGAPDGGKCRLTGATTFEKALAAIFADKALAERVVELEITLNLGSARILFDKSQNSVFTSRIVKSPEVLLSVSISSDTIRKLANVLT